MVTAKWGVTPEKSFYCGIDHDKNTIEYVFYLNEEEPPVYQGIKMDVYQASLQIVESIVTEEPNAFLRIEQWCSKRNFGNTSAYAARAANRAVRTRRKQPIRRH